MKLLLKRRIFTDKSTIGELYVNGVPECWICEDKDRGLDVSMPLSEIIRLKVKGQTCIPYGYYKVIVTMSERFSRIAGKDVYLPMLLNVPGYEGVRIHKGNKPEDTEGCLLPGTHKDIDFVSNSATAFINLNDKINLALKKGEDVFIEITK